MQQSLKILMAQINPTVGAITKNTAMVIDCIKKYQDNHDVIVFPELVLTGYPPEDLLLRNELFEQIDKSIEQIQKVTTDCFVIVGHPSQSKDSRFNSASIIHQHHLVTRYHKQHLPNYGVFDELRYFKASKPNPCVFEVHGYHLGVCICEDVWEKGPVEDLIEEGCDILLCINASPFEHDKAVKRQTLLKYYAQKGISIIYVNQVGGQDELVFDGQSFALDNQGKLVAQAKAFEQGFETVIFNEQHVEAKLNPVLNNIELIYNALVCGLKDYVEKNHFPGVIIGLSGGIDSALTLAIAVDALGPERVHAVMMPSRYTASISREDAMAQLNNLNVKHSTLSIEPTFEAILNTFHDELKKSHPKTVEENIQARIRGLFLMALSNQSSMMVVTTSNKSEAAVGYSTIYGDMVGGLAILKDVYKTQVYQLAAYRNSISDVIPNRVLTRPPTAELSENQTDQDTLPAYEELDGIIYAHMEQNESIDGIIKLGYDKDTVKKIIRLITLNEYKRRQSAPGIKVSSRSFDKDWRTPITSGFS
tara:strand:- start:1314 stop:2915 length:1602 start_codon:yes stop_codon:yes gene_type:complete